MEINKPKKTYFHVTRLQASIRLLILIDLDHNLNYATKRTEKDADCFKTIKIPLISQEVDVVYLNSSRPEKRVFSSGPPFLVPPNPPPTKVTNKIHIRER